MITDIRSGEIDAGVLWGPIAGYFAAKGGEQARGRAAAEGDRPARAWPIASPSACAISRTTGSAQLNALIAKRQGDIDAVLLQYGVPLLDEDTKLIEAPRK